MKRNSFKVHWKYGACQKWEPAGRIGDFGNFLNGFAKSPRVLRTVLNIEWVQFVLKNREILHFVWGLYDKNSASYYCFTSDVMYVKSMKCWFTRTQSCWQDFVKWSCQTQKTRPDSCFPRIRFPGLIYCDVIMWSKMIAIFWVYIFGYQFDVRFFFSL